MTLFRSRRWLGGIALGLVLTLAVAGGLSVVWLSRYRVAVHQLTRGMGDTIFYDADGQAWFRLDE